MRLRDVTLGDVELYARLRCDPVVMAELGGALPRDGIEAKVQKDVATVTSGDGWICAIETAAGEAVGIICIWTLEGHSEIGWMIAREHQGRGLGRAAAALILERARADGRWGDIHAFTSVTNIASNRICRALDFAFVEETNIAYEGRTLRSNHYVKRSSGGSHTGLG